VLTLFGSIGQLVGASVVGAVAASSGGSAAGYGNAYLVTGGDDHLFLAAFSLKGAQLSWLQQFCSVIG